MTHSRLATNFLDLLFKDFIDHVWPHIARLHIVGADGIDVDGVPQLGASEIDIAPLSEQLSHVAQRASFIPEIWQGDNNDGEWFRVNCERIKKWFSAAASVNAT